MSGRAVARGVVTLIAAGLVLGAPARANDTAHKIADKFADTTNGADANKPADARQGAKQQDKDKTEAAQQEAKRKAAEAKKRAAELRAQAARKAAEAKRKAAEATRRAADERRADEADMLARARREADEMRAAEEHARLTQEARRLIEEAEKERAKAEALLASQGGDQQHAKASEEESLVRQRMEETRRLAEKLNRVRQIREARLAAQARRKAEEQVTALTPETQAAPPPAEASPAVKPVETPPAVAAVVPEAPPVPLAVPPQAVAPPPITASAAPPPPPPAAAPETSPGSQPQPRVAGAEMGLKIPAEIPAAKLQSEVSARAPARLSDPRVTVLLIMEPGNYGIRRRGPKVADPVLCVPDGCYVSTGADQPAVFMPGRRALSFGNTWGARAGACRGSLGCVFRGIDLGSVPGYLQPVDLHILRHDRRQVYAVLADSGCRAEAGRLSCTHGIYAEDYTMWILPESLAATAGPAALERAVADGLNGPRSAELKPR